jgi:anti-sigma B factor antagonist
MTPLGAVRVQRHGDVPVAAVEGEVDAGNAAEIGADLRGLLTNQSTDLVIDLSPTRYLDSAGINLLFSLGAELQARQLRLRIVIARGSPVARMLSLTGLDRAHPTYGAVHEALKST